VALSKLCRLYFKKEQVDCLAYAKVVEAKRLAAEERSCAFKAQVTASACLFCLEKVYKKVCLKEYRLIKQGFHELESEERGPSCFVAETNPNSLVVESSVALRLPLANLFFNFSFFLLPDLISFNII